jgi:hypothetical protein
LFGGELGSETRSHCFVGAEKPSKCYFLVFFFPIVFVLEIIDDYEFLMNFPQVDENQL